MTHKPRFRTLTAAITLATATITATAGTPDFQLDLRGSFAGNGAEILSHDSSTGRVFVTNSNDNTVDVIDISDPDTPVLLLQIDVSPYGAGVTSVAANDGLIAAAIESASATTPGVIAVFDPDGNLLRIFGAGVLPDNVVFSPDGNYILSANEGEPNGTDPRGSVTVIDLTEGLDKATAQLADFSAFDGQEATLRARGVRIFDGTVAGRDLEPEYVAVSPAGDVAYVTLQEANAVGVVDLATATVLDVLPLGLKDHSRGLPAAASIEFPALPVLGTTPAGQEILLGGFSGLWYEGMDATSGALQFVTVPDRGPNGEPTDVDNDGAVERPFVLPDYQARVVRFELATDNTISITDTLLLTRADGTTPITGLPNIDGADEEPVDLNGNALPLDEFGADLEGVVIDGAGNYWMVDEYRPAIYQFDPAGQLLNRYIPEGTAAAAGQPVGTYGSETLPAEYANRRRNRGFEAMALDTDAGILYAFIQTPLSNPDRAAGDASRIIRMLGIDPADGSVVAEYVYVLNKPAFREGNVDKIGDAVYAGNSEFYVIERDSAVSATAKKPISKISLLGATNLRDPSAPALNAGLTLEQHTPDDLAGLGIRPVDKVKITNLPSIGYQAGDKPEGLALLPDGRLAVLNDNDFGLLDTPIPVDGSVPLNPEPTPVVLGLIDFTQPAGLDASDRDNAINITNWPVWGMFMPDTIATYADADGNTYFVTANEGDDRGEDERIGDLTLDPTVFPNATDLQQNEQLGRLGASTVDGNLDDDPELERLQVYGARSFTIWDRFGNLVYDSGDDLEQRTAAAFPDHFNSNNDEGPSLESRSDNKGPEPEALAVATLPDGRVVAYVGLERIGGVAAYDVTDPRNVTFLQYVNNRDFTQAFDEDALLIDPTLARDLAPEGIVVFTGPEGKPMVGIANEVSFTTTLYDISVDTIFNSSFEGDD